MWDHSQDTLEGWVSSRGRYSTRPTWYVSLSARCRQDVERHRWQCHPASTATSHAHRPAARAQGYTIVPVRRRRESEGRDRQVFSQFSYEYNRCEPSHVGRSASIYAMSFCVCRHDTSTEDTCFTDIQRLILTLAVRGGPGADARRTPTRPSRIAPSDHGCMQMHGPPPRMEAAREKDETPRANMGSCSWTLDEIRGVQAAQGSRM